jgi:hypothetical protein
MGKANNDQLLSYFNDRHAWLLTIDYEEPPSKVPSYELRDLR